MPSHQHLEERPAPAGLEPLAAWYAEQLARCEALTDKRRDRRVQPDDVLHRALVVLLEKTREGAAKQCDGHGRALEQGIQRFALSHEQREIGRFARRNGLGRGDALAAATAPAHSDPALGEGHVAQGLSHLPEANRMVAEQVRNGQSVEQIAALWGWDPCEVARVAAWTRIRMTPRGRHLPAHVGRDAGRVRVLRGEARRCLVRLMQQADWDRASMAAELGLESAALRQLLLRYRLARPTL